MTLIPSSNSTASKAQFSFKFDQLPSPTISAQASTGASSTSLSAMSNISDSSSMTSSDVSPGESLKLVIVCVGLPARGKSYITKKLQRYFNWSQFNTKIFNVGNTRREKHTGPSEVPVLGPISNNCNTAPKKQEKSTENKHIGTSTTHDASFFDSSNKENLKLREKWAKETLNRLLDYLQYEDGNVGIFDATNTTKNRRKWIVETVTSRMKGSAKILFLESICTDGELIEKNIHLKLMGPDYRSMKPKLALEDFRNRLRNYESVYETIDEIEEMENQKYDVQYVKIINAGKKITSYNISGYLSSQCVFFLLNFNLTDRQIWLTPNGETEDDVRHIIGGDSDLSTNGWKFAKALPKFIARKRQEFNLRQLNKQFVKNSDFFSFHNGPHIEQKFNVWTSTLKRTNETAQYFSHNEYQMKSFRMLNDICYGSLDSSKDYDFRIDHFDEYYNMIQNKLSYRFPGLGGESYLDLISRLRPIIIELERCKEHVLLISHRVVIRVLLCYFMDLSKEMLTELDVHHGYIYCIEPKPYGLDLKIWQYDETTDDFYEVDEIELMKRKRKRLSLSVDNEYKPVLKSCNSNAAVDESYASDDDDETKIQKEPSITDIKQYQKVFCERSDSQCYGFMDSNTGKERSEKSNVEKNSDTKSISDKPLEKAINTPDVQDKLDKQISSILANKELVSRLKELLI